MLSSCTSHSFFIVEVSDDLDIGTDDDIPCGQKCYSSVTSDLSKPDMPPSDDDFIYKPGDSEVSNLGLLQYIKSKKSLNTVRKTTRDLQRFMRFLADAHSEYREVFDIPPRTLDVYIGEWILSLKKPNGQMYEPDTLTSFHRSVDRHLRDNNYGYSLVDSPEFATSKQVLAAKRKELCGLGLGNKPNKAEVLTEKDEDLLWLSGQLGLDTPHSLSNTVWYHCTKLFGFRGGHETRQLRWGDVSLKSDESGSQYLEFNERLSKTRQGNSSHLRPFAPKAFPNTLLPERCPVAAFKLYAAHRPTGFNDPDSPFFVSINHSWYPGSNIAWYKNSPMGQKLLSAMIKSMSVKAGIVHKKLTNHSVRKTMCTTLLQNNVPPTLIAQLSGHKNVQSLANYCTASVDQQKDMCAILQGSKSTVGKRSSQCHVPLLPNTLDTTSGSINPLPKKPKLSHTNSTSTVTSSSSYEEFVAPQNADSPTTSIITLPSHSNTDIQSSIHSSQVNSEISSTQETRLSQIFSSASFKDCTLNISFNYSK